MLKGHEMSIECGYSNVNFARLSETPHHRRPKVGPVLVHAPEGYPQKAKTNQRRRHPGKMSVKNLGEEWTPLPGRDIMMLGPVDADGRREKFQLGIWRGVDKSVLSGTYDGLTLRMLRAQKGCGRPFISNVWRKDDGIRSESPSQAPNSDDA
jgi:hypothetical protein